MANTSTVTGDFSNNTVWDVAFTGTGSGTPQGANGVSIPTDTTVITRQPPGGYTLDSLSWKNDTTLSGATHSIEMRESGSTTNMLRYLLSGSTWNVRVGASTIATFTKAAGDAEPYFRFRKDATNFYWETSANSAFTSPTVRATQAIGSIPFANFYIRFQSGAGGTGAWVVKDVNVTGTAKALTGSSTGTSTAAGGSPTRVRAFTASSTGTSSPTGTPLRERKLTGSSTGTSTASGTMPIAKMLTGSSTGTSTAGGTGRRIRAGAGSSTGTSLAQGHNVRRTRLVAGSSTGTSTASGTLSKVQGLTASANGTSSASGTTLRSRGLLGSCTGSSTAQAVASRSVAASGASTGTSSSSGRLGYVRLLEGLSAGSSTASGSAGFLKWLTGFSAGTTTASGSVLSDRELTGSATGSSSAYASIGMQANRTRAGGVLVSAGYPDVEISEGQTGVEIWIL